MTQPLLPVAIDAFNANDLGTILRHAGVADVPKTKEGKVRLWLEQVKNPERISRELARLPDRCRRALAVLQAADGELRTLRFRSLLERGGITGSESKRGRAFVPVRPEAVANPVTFAEVLAALLKSGLIWTHTLPEGVQANARLDFAGGRYVYIPHEIARHLPSPALGEKALPQVTQTVSGSARTCQRDLYLVWSAVREIPMQLTAANLVRMADLKRLAGQLLVSETIETGAKESDYRRVFFLRRLLSALTLLEEDGPIIRANPDPLFFAAGPVSRVRASFQSWRDGAWWNELWTTYVQGKTRASGGAADFAPGQVVAARRKVLETLVYWVKRLEAQQKSTEVWVAVDDLSDTLHDRDDGFLVDRETAAQADSYRSYYRPTPYASPYQYNALGWAWEAYANSEEQGWNGVERTFIQAVLTEGLFWLGLVDLGYARPVTPGGGKAPDGLLAVRLTDMGRWLLLDGPAPAIPEETGRVVLQPNFRVFAFDPISDSVLARLDSFAVRLNAERAVEYEITRDSVYRAQLAGQDVGQIQAWLEQTTGAAVPQNVGRSLDEWQAAFERITVRPRVGWIEVASPALAEALLAQPRLNQIIIKQVTPTGFIARSDRMDELENALLAAGELPARSSGRGDARRGSILLSDDGTIRSALAVPSLYVYGLLQPFCDRTPAGWRITAASVARAVDQGLDAAAILAELEQMAVGGVSAPLRARIKTWSRHYGRATLRSLILLQFRDQETLDELLEDPELQPYLKPFKPEARLGLATVAPEAQEHLSKLLTERGVDLT